jgi:ABC-type bacteriocin/lantibiotic exporter with double-glycine peptidase domain
LVGLWQQFQQANFSVQRMGDIMNAPQNGQTDSQHDRVRKFELKGSASH